MRRGGSERETVASWSPSPPHNFLSEETEAEISMTMMPFTTSGWWSLLVERRDSQSCISSKFFQKKRKKRENPKWSRSKTTLYHKKFTLHLFMKFGP
jgi:hypothetical protein